MSVRRMARLLSDMVAVECLASAAAGGVGSVFFKCANGNAGRSDVEGNGQHEMQAQSLIRSVDLMKLPQVRHGGSCMARGRYSFVPVLALNHSTAR